MYESMTLLEFQKRFASKEDCLQYLFEKRWPNGFECPRCSANKAYYLSARKLHQCAECRHQTSVTARTIFHRTRTPLRVWFWMIFLMSRNKAGHSMLGLQKLLGIRGYRTAWSMGHKIRKAMADRNGCYQLAGLIEMDDAYFGGSRPEKRGRGAHGKARVLVAAENRGDRPGFASMDVVDRIDEEAVRRVTRERIRAEQTIRTDGYSSFRTLTKEGFDHQRLLIGCPQQASEKFPWVHTLISNAKSVFQGIHHGVALRHLHRYLAEYCYRFNRRYWEEELFDRLLTACSFSTPVSFAELKQ